MKLTKRTSSPGTWRDGERFEVVPEGTVAALEQECEHQREIINGSDHLSRIAALEQELDEWQERDDVRCRLIAEQGAEVERLRAALQWLVNLAHGMGKAGGPPEEGEWDAAWKNAADCLIGALTEGED